MTTLLSFEQFKSACQQCSNPDNYDIVTEHDILLYLDRYYIEVVNQELYMLNIGNYSELSPNLLKLEKVLYDYYVSEEGEL